MTKYLFVYHGATGPVPTDPAVIKAIHDAWVLGSDRWDRL